MPVAMTIIKNAQKKSKQLDAGASPKAVQVPSPAIIEAGDAAAAQQATSFKKARDLWKAGENVVDVMNSTGVQSALYLAFVLVFFALTARTPPLLGGHSMGGISLRSNRLI